MTKKEKVKKYAARVAVLLEHELEKYSEEFLDKQDNLEIYLHYHFVRYTHSQITSGSTYITERTQGAIFPRFAIRPLDIED